MPRLTYLILVVVLTLITPHGSVLANAMFDGQLAWPDTLIKHDPDTNITTIGDTIIYDTIIIIKEPVIINRQVVVVDTVEPLPFYFSAGLQFAPLFSYTNTKPTDDSFIPFSDLRKRTHKTMTGFSAGAHFTVNYQDWLLQTGLSYTRQREKLDYGYSLFSFDTSYVTQFDTLDEYIMVNGTDTTWFYVTDSSEEMMVDSSDIGKHINSNNKFNYIEVPLVAGYEFIFNRVTIMPKAGIIFGFFLNAKGTTISASDTLTSLDLSTCKEFKPVVFSLFLSTAIAYEVTESIYVFADLRYIAGLSSMFKSSYPVAHRYNSPSISFGVSYYF